MFSNRQHQATKNQQENSFWKTLRRTNIHNNLITNAKTKQNGKLLFLTENTSSIILSIQKTFIALQTHSLMISNTSTK